jgi:hypothetical protein
MKLRISTQGRVIVVGRDTAADGPESPAHAPTSELAYCLARVLEKESFPPPAGEGVIIVPFAHRPAGTL